MDQQIVWITSIIGEDGLISAEQQLGFKRNSTPVVAILFLSWIWCQTYRYL